MSTSKQDKDVEDNSIKRSTVDTTKIINQTFDDAKNIRDCHGICRLSPIIKNRQ